MKNMSKLLTLLVVGIILVSACGGEATIVDTQVAPSQPPAADTEPPSLTEVPIQPTDDPPAIVPVDLVVPPMEVGSKVTYVDGSVLIAVPGGEFIMGNGGPDSPIHTVNLSEFWIYRGPVTNTQYAFCVAQGKCSLPDTQKNKEYGQALKANHPVTAVNYEQAAMYCDFVHGRLPTEAEWEKTARGPDGNMYPWGDATPQCDFANYSLCENKTTSVVDHPDGMSYYDALDMAGNIFEWVADWYDINYYDVSPLDNPSGPNSGIKRSVRSNGFLSPAFESESARRFSLKPIQQQSDLGFRCVIEDPAYFAPSCESVQVTGIDPLSGLPLSGGYQEICPTVGIQQNPYCNGLQPVTNVILTSSDPSAQKDSANCSPDQNNPDLFICIPLGGIVSVQAFCQQNIIDPVCPPGYTQQGNECVSQGGAGECLPGTNYDPVAQCCSALPGGDSAFDLPQCPLGTYYLSQQDVCVPYPAQGIVSVAEAITFKGCLPDPTRTPGGGGCTPLTNEQCRVQSGGAKPLFCASLCACISAFSGCP